MTYALVNTDLDASDTYPAFQNLYDGAGQAPHGLSASVYASEVSSVFDLGTSTDPRDDRFLQLKGKSDVFNPIFLPLRSAAERASVFNSSYIINQDGIEYRKGPTAEDPVYPQITAATSTKFPGVRLTARKLPVPGSGSAPYVPAQLFHDTPNALPGGTNGYYFTTATRTSGGADDGYYTINLPWAVAFGPNHYTSIHVGTNSYVTFGQGSTTFAGINFNNPNLPKICIGSGDNSSNLVKYRQESGTGRTGSFSGLFIVYFRGTGNTGYAEETISATNDNLIEWEMYFYQENPGIIDIQIKHMPKHRSRWSSSSSGTSLDTGLGFSGANHSGGQEVIPGVTAGKGACTFTVGKDEFIRIKNVGEQIFRTTAGLGTVNGDVCVSISQSGSVLPPTSGYYGGAYTSADACPAGWTDMTNVNTPQAYQYPTFQALGALLPSGTAAGHMQAVTNPNDYAGAVGNWRIKSNASGASFGFRNGAPYEYTNVTTTVGWGARTYWGWGCPANFYLAATVRYCVPFWSNVFGLA